MGMEAAQETKHAMAQVPKRKRTVPLFFIKPSAGKYAFKYTINARGSGRFPPVKGPPRLKSALRILAPVKFRADGIEWDGSFEEVVP
jgi:hypothetical protein